MYDVIVLGGGPAGLSASIYTTRRGLKTLLLTKDIGGQIARANEIENYPGFTNIKGADLTQKFFDQTKSFGTEVVLDEAVEIKQGSKHFSISTGSTTFETKAVILTAGKTPRQLGVSGEEKFKGRGVSYCSTCDGPFFRNKTVVIVGGGNSAMDAAIVTSKIATKVFIVNNLKDFTGEKIMADKVKASKKIEIIQNNGIKEIKGENKVTSVVLNDGREIPTDGVIVEIGYMIDQKLIKDLVKLDERGQVIIDNRQQTSVPGIFAAGDITNVPYKQVVISAGDGAKAALSCYDYIAKSEGRQGTATY